MFLSQINQETLAALIAHCSATTKKVGRGPTRNSSAAPSATAPSTSVSLEPSKLDTLMADPPSMITISTDESDSYSSFPESSESEDEGENSNGSNGISKTSRTPRSQSVRQKQVKPLSETKSSPDGMVTDTDSKDSASGAKNSSRQEEVPPGWTGAEVTYFNLLQPIFGHNFCTIAEILRTKKCQEVYEYSQQLGSSVLLHGGNREHRLANKKKKKNMR